MDLSAGFPGIQMNGKNRPSIPAIPLFAPGIHVFKTPNSLLWKYNPNRQPLDRQRPNSTYGPMLGVKGNEAVIIAIYRCACTVVRRDGHDGTNADAYADSVAAAKPDGYPRSEE